MIVDGQMWRLLILVYNVDIYVCCNAIRGSQHRANDLKSERSPTKKSRTRWEPLGVDDTEDKHGRSQTFRPVYKGHEDLSKENDSLVIRHIITYSPWLLWDKHPLSSYFWSICVCTGKGIVAIEVTTSLEVTRNPVFVLFEHSAIVWYEFIHSTHSVL